MRSRIWNEHRSFMVFLLVAAGLWLTACDDNTGDGKTDACTGALCDGTDFKPTDTGVPDTSTIDTAMPPDTAEPPCSAGETECYDLKTLRFCVNEKWDEQLCLGNEVCDESVGACVPPLCPVPGLPFRCEDQSSEHICGTDQLSWDIVDCQEGESCHGQGCAETICTPLHRRCKPETNEIEECNAAGTGYDVVETCADTQVCGSSGQCTELCELNAKTASFLGCEYFVVDLDNDGGLSSPCTESTAFMDCLLSTCVGPAHNACTASDPWCRCQDTMDPAADDKAFGITVSNPHPDLTASVTITGGGTTISETVAAGNLVEIPLPSHTDQNVSGLFPGSTFFVGSSIPVTVHQFNPMNESGVASNDASLLLPVNALGTNYINLGYPLTVPFEIGPEWGGVAGLLEVYADVVAAEDGTTVTITSPVEIPGYGSFSSIAAGVPTNVSMNRGDLLHLVSGADLGTDLSGLEIVADKPVAAFSGSRCGSVPDLTSYCDHMEQQLLPVSTWGTSYYAAKFSPRGAEKDFWRIIAAEADTVVTFDPPQGATGISTATLGRGQVFDLESDGDFKITASKPVLAGQFMSGSNYPGIPADDACFGSGIGDPAFSLAVPTDQYRSDYIVMTPLSYREDYVTIIAQQGRVPMLDGILITDAPYNATPSAIGTEADVYRILVTDGVHTIQANAGFGVMAYGYDCDVSYAYPGGLNLTPIN